MANEANSMLLSIDANITKLIKKLDQAEKASDTSANKMQQRFNKLEEQTGVSFGKLGDNLHEQLTKGISGAAEEVPILGEALNALGGPFLAVAGGAGLLAGALDKAKEAMEWGRQLQDTADHLGVTAETLQVLQFAAKESGVPIEAVSEDLQGLNAALGAIQSGVASAKIEKAFKALHISRDQLLGMKNANELLPILADKISNLSSRAEQIQLAKKLGIEDILPLLQQGSAGLDEFGDHARALGLVIDNGTTEKLKELSKESELASDRIDIQLKKAFIDLAPAITFATTKLADFLQFLTQKAPTGNGSIGGLLFKLSAGIGIPGASGLIDAATALLGDKTGDKQKPQGPERSSTKVGPPAKTDEELAKEAAAAKAAAEKARAAAQKAAEQQARDASSQSSADRDLLSARIATARNATERLYLEEQALNDEKKDKDVEIDAQVKAGKISAAVGEQLKAVNTETTAIKRKNLLQQGQIAIMQERMEAERFITDATVQLLQAQSAIAKTATERRKIEEQLLAIAQKQARDELEAEIAADPDRKRITNPDQARATLGQIQAAQTQGLRESQLDPLTKFLKGVQDIKADELQSAADALKDLNSALVDTIINGGKASDAVDAFVKKLASDFLNLEFQQLESSIFAIFGLANGRVPGFARGRTPGFASGRLDGNGVIHGPGGPRDDKILALMGNQPIRVSPQESIINARSTRKYGPLLKAINEDRLGAFADGKVDLATRVARLTAGGVPQTLKSGPAPVYKFDLRGAVMTQDLVSQMNAIGRQATVLGAQGGAQLARTQAARIQRRTLS